MSGPDDEQQFRLIASMCFTIQGFDGSDGYSPMHSTFTPGHSSDQQLCYHLLRMFDIKQLHSCAAGEERFRDDNTGHSGQSRSRKSQERFCMMPEGTHNPGWGPVDGPIVPVPIDMLSATSGPPATFGSLAKRRRILARNAAITHYCSDSAEK